MIRKKETKNKLGNAKSENGNLISKGHTLDREREREKE
jgi:hypothetical protein